MAEEVAHSDLSKVPISESTNGCANNGNYGKPLVKSTDVNIEGKNMACLAGLPTEGEGTKISGVEVTNSEVEYINSENLKDVEDLENCLMTLLAKLGSKDWISVCDALNNVRRLSMYHKEAIVEILNDIISLVVKSLKNPRSALCKTAIMTSADIFNVYNDQIIDSLDTLLVQLLLKSSQDKKFVCEAAESALIALTGSVSPHLLLPKLQPYTKNKNPRIRAKASMCISRSVQQLGVDGVEAFGIEKLIQIGATQLSDQLPESRDAARTLLLKLRSVYQKIHVLEPSSEEPIASWEHFCQSKLSPLSAQAVLRATNIAREGLVSIS